ncbi:MAG TPA: hypothetical protein VGE62_03615 [Candidatus Paceibacterota bacterium]
MIKISKSSFLKVFGRVFEAYERKSGIFAEHSAEVSGPQHIHCPQGIERGSPDHLYWLALVAMSDRRTNSMVLYRNFAKMFGDNPSLFVRGVLLEVETVTVLFRTYKIALPVSEIAFFIERKRHLDECFRGDPLLIYDCVKNVSELMRKLKSIARSRGIGNIFPGAKEKIFCLLAMFLRKFSGLQFADVVPVDVWVQSISVSTRVVKGKGRMSFGGLGKRLRPLMQKAFLPYLDVPGATDATWILGKFGCTLCAGKDMTTLCPLYDICRGPFERPRNQVSNKHVGMVELPPKYKRRCSEK